MLLLTGRIVPTKLNYFYGLHFKNFSYVYTWEFWSGGGDKIVSKKWVIFTISLKNSPEMYICEILIKTKNSDKNIKFGHFILPLSLKY